MKDKRDKTDWGKGSWRKAIVEQRKYLWLPEAIEKYASWMGLKHEADRLPARGYLKLHTAILLAATTPAVSNVPPTNSLLSITAKP